MRETLLRGAALLVSKAMYELTERAAFASQGTTGPADDIAVQRSDVAHVSQLIQASAEAGAVVNHTRFLCEEEGDRSPAEHLRRSFQVWGKATRKS